MAWAAAAVLGLAAATTLAAAVGLVRCLHTAEDLEW